MATEFKRDINTVSELKDIIKNSAINPKPVVETMWYIFDWRGFVANSLWPLSYHTRYNSFKLTKEENEVKFRCKRFPQSAQYGPPSGIMLVKNDLDIRSHVGSGDFRIDFLDLDHLMQYINKRFQTLPLLERIDVISSWDLICKKLRDLPRKKESLEKMSLVNLPIQPDNHNARALPVTEDENYSRAIEERECRTNVEEGDIEEILPGMDVAVYTEQKRL